MAILERLKNMQNDSGKNRLVMILDGMGVAIVKKLLDKDGFLPVIWQTLKQRLFPLQRWRLQLRTVLEKCHGKLVLLVGRNTLQKQMK